MISKIVSILTIGVAALFVAAPGSVYAVNAVQAQASVASLRKQLTALPKHAAVFGKINSLLTQLVTKDPKNAASYLKIAQDKVATANAVKNAKLLGTKTTSIVNKSKTLKASQKTAILKAINKLIKSYVPPGPTNPPYQAMLLQGAVIA